MNWTTVILCIADMIADVIVLTAMGEETAIDAKEAPKGT